MLLRFGDESDGASRRMDSDCNMSYWLHNVEPYVFPKSFLSTCSVWRYSLVQSYVQFSSYTSILELPPQVKGEGLRQGVVQRSLLLGA